jgi:hypothetical protein
MPDKVQPPDQTRREPLIERQRKLWQVAEAKFDPEALACFKPKAYRINTPLPMPAIKAKTDWTLPNGGRTVATKRNPSSTAETCTTQQVH